MLSFVLISLAKLHLISVSSRISSSLLTFSYWLWVNTILKFIGIYKSKKILKIILKIEAMLTRRRSYRKCWLTLIGLSKSMKYWWILHVVFSMLFWYRIDIISKLASWRSRLSCFHFLLWQVSPLAIYFNWSLFLIRCNFNFKPKRMSNIDIAFTLKRHYCPIVFGDTQHNSEFTYLHLKFARCVVTILPRCKYLLTKITDIFLTVKRR